MKELLKKIQDYMNKQRVDELAELPQELQDEINEKVAPEIVYKGLATVLHFLGQF